RSVRNQDEIPFFFGSVPSGQLEMAFAMDAGASGAAFAEQIADEGDEAVHLRAAGHGGSLAGVTWSRPGGLSGGLAATGLPKRLNRFGDSCLQLGRGVQSASAVMVAVPKSESSDSETRDRACLKYCGSTSKPMLFRPQSPAAAEVVPVPRKGSRTVSPAKLNMRIKRVANSAGYGAGWLRVEAPARPVQICWNHSRCSSALMRLS